MPVFKYVATDAYGTQVAGKYDAVTEQEVRIYLRSAGLSAQKITRSFLKAEVTFGKKVTGQELVVFTRMFAAMAKAAIPLDQTLKILYKQSENPKLKQAVQRIIVDVESGQSLGESMRKQPAVFSVIYVNMVTAGEASGNLDLLMERLAELMERTEAIQGKIKGALIYPVVLLCVGIAAVAALLIFVLPQFVDVFKSSGVPLPWPTRFAINMSNFLVKDWWVLVLGAAGIAVGIGQVKKAPGFVRLRDTVGLKLPVFGPLIVKGAVARFTRTLSTLIGSGVGIIDALDLTAETAGNVRITEAIRVARASIATGDDIAAPLERSGIFPSLMTSMVAVGEQAGELESMLSKVADFYEQDVNRAVDAALKLIEPAMLVVLGGMVAMVMLSLYLPLFDMISVVGDQ